MKADPSTLHRMTLDLIRAAGLEWDPGCALGDLIEGQAAKAAGDLDTCAERWFSAMEHLRFVLPVRAPEPVADVTSSAEPVVVEVQGPKPKPNPVPRHMRRTKCSQCGQAKGTTAFAKGSTVCHSCRKVQDGTKPDPKSKPPREYPSVVRQRELRAQAKALAESRGERTAWISDAANGDLSEYIRVCQEADKLRAAQPNLGGVRVVRLLNPRRCVVCDLAKEGREFKGEGHICLDCESVGQEAPAGAAEATGHE
jgi:hypothetical protein